MSCKLSGYEAPVDSKDSIFHKLKNIFFFEFNLEFTKQREVFVLERSSLMMFFLILYVPDDRIKL